MRICLECGCGYEAQRADSQFCKRECKGVFANRRAVRGAELYDLFMAFRYDRDVASKLGLFGVMCRLAYHYHREDQEKRKGFKSWIDPNKVLDRRPYLRSSLPTSLKIGRKNAA